VSFSGKKWFTAGHDKTATMLLHTNGKIEQADLMVLNRPVRSGDWSGPLESPDRPQTVTTAILMLWISFALSVFCGIFSAINLMSPDSLHFRIILLTFLVFFSFQALLILKIGQGRHWARVAFWIFTILGFLGALETIFDPSLSWWTGQFAMGIIDLIFTTIALILLYQAQSNEWFRIERGQDKRDAH
jgi:hypothetical protein